MPLLQDRLCCHAAIHVTQANASTKLVSIRSDMFVENCTDCTVNLLIERSGLKDEFVFIPPFGSASCAVRRSVFIVPGDLRHSCQDNAVMDVTTHEWAEVRIDGKIGSQQVCCEPKVDSVNATAHSFLWNCIQGCQSAHRPKSAAPYRVQMHRDTSGLGLDISNDLAIVTAVRGPAAEAGIQVGWRIVECNRRTTRSKNQVVAELAIAGKVIELGFDTQDWTERDDETNHELVGSMSFQIVAPLVIQNRMPCDVSITFLNTVRSHPPSLGGLHSPFLLGFDHRSDVLRRGTLVPSTTSVQAQTCRLSSCSACA